MEAKFRRIRELFAKPGVIYQVPEYQRGFEWEERNFDDLWTDLERIGERVDKHYLGNIILLSKGGGRTQTREIVDGQQRMVTISTLLMAVRDSEVSDGLNDRRIDEVLNSYPKSDRERRLHLYDDQADESFEALWRGERGDANGNVQSAYDFFSQKIEPLSQQEINDLISKVVENLQVVETTSTDDSLAYMIFQSQNERGMEVSPEILVKARVFGEAERLDEHRKQEEVKGRWRQMCRQFKKNLTRPRFQDDYAVRRPLTHILANSKYPTSTEIGKGNLYREFDEVLQSHGDVAEFVQWFSNQADTYLNVSSNSYDVDLRGYSRQARRNIQYLNSASSHGEVLSLAILNQAGESDPVKEYLRLGATLAMRMLAADYRPRDRRSAVHVAAKEIREGEDIRHTLKEIIDIEGPTDAEIIETLKSKDRTTQGSWTFRTLLQLVSIEEGRRGPVSVDLTNLDVEHIAPRNTFGNSRYAEWRRDLDEESFEESYDHLGNLTLLDASDHSGIKETSFREKKRIYANSDLRLTEEVSGYENWNLAQIEQRTGQLAQEFAEVWTP